MQGKHFLKQLVCILQVRRYQRLELLKPVVEPSAPVVHEGASAAKDRSHLPRRLVHLACLSEPSEFIRIEFEGTIQKSKLCLTNCDIVCGFFLWLVFGHPVSELVLQASLVAECLFLSQLFVIPRITKVF